VLYIDGAAASSHKYEAAAFLGCVAYRLMSGR
jgi:hypothetical protein